MWQDFHCYTSWIIGMFFSIVCQYDHCCCFIGQPYTYLRFVIFQGVLNFLHWFSFFPCVQGPFSALHTLVWVLGSWTLQNAMQGFLTSWFPFGLVSGKDQEEPGGQKEREVSYFFPVPSWPTFLVVFMSFVTTTPVQQPLLHESPKPAHTSVCSHFIKVLEPSEPPGSSFLLGLLLIPRLKKQPLFLELLLN